jgi:putative cell wall-binding protein
VYLTVGTNHPDAIAAGPAAAAEGAPILLVTPTGLPEETRLELQRLDPSLVVIVGGEAAVSEAAVSEVEAAVPEAQLVRRAGSSRYETAVEVSKAAFPGGAATVFVATGENFSDAVVAAPAAILMGGPLLLVPTSGVPAAVRDEITRLGPSRIVVVGGTGAVGDAAFSELTGLAPTVERISGSDQYAISAAVSATFFAPGSTAFIAVGTAFPDALAAGPATAASSGPVLLVQADAIPAVIATELTRLGPRRLVILGGTAAVSSGVETALAGFVQL